MKPLKNIKFDEDQNLGQVIEKKQLFSFGAAPVTQFKEIVFAAGGNKFSSLCGFKFISKADTQFKEFFIAFVCKLRSKIYHTAINNPSQWFIFKKISPKEMHCMDKKTMLLQYGFDVDKFFASDFFAKSLLRLKGAVRKGLDEYVPAYVKAHGAEKAIGLLTSYDGRPEDTVSNAVGTYVTAIDDSLEYIDSTQCNNKFYKLIDYDIKVEKEDVMNEAYEKPIDIEFNINKPLTVKELKAQLNKFKDDDIIDVCSTNGERGYAVVELWNANAEFEMTGVDDGRDDICYMRIMPSKVNNESKIDEDDIVEEASRWECEVEKEEEDGEAVWKVYEKQDHFWVATFHDEHGAMAFAKEYPKLKEDYIKKARAIESDKQMIEKEEPTDEEISEQELDAKIEEAMKKIYR